MFALVIVWELAHVLLVPSFIAVGVLICIAAAPSVLLTLIALLVEHEEVVLRVALHLSDGHALARLWVNRVYHGSHQVALSESSRRHDCSGNSERGLRTPHPYLLARFN